MTETVQGLDRFTKVYIKIRDKRAELKAAFDKEDSDLKLKQESLENAMLAQMNATGAKSVRTDFGTVYRQEEVKPSASDWDSLYRWIKENDAFDALERRVKKTFVTEYMETHDGALPPGVSVHREFVVRVRRS